MSITKLSYKTLTLIILITAMLCCAVSVALAEEMLDVTMYTPVYGDANFDGEVNTADAVRVLQFCCGIRNMNSLQKVNADVTGDGKVNTADSVTIMRYVVGTLKSMPVEGEVESNVIAFENDTFPGSGKRVNYGKSYNLKGTITSDNPILSVSIKVIDNSSSKVEAYAVETFSASDKIRRYNTFTSPNAIDDDVRFGALSIGEKTIKLYASDTQNKDVLMYVDSFTVGFSYDELASNIYLSGNKPSVDQIRAILMQINSLDVVNTQSGKLISEAVRLLGTPYDELDCSGFARRSYSKGLGISLPRTAAEQSLYCAQQGANIDISELKSGDLVFMSRNDCDCGRYHEVHHVALYFCTSMGERYLIESTGSKNGVCIRGIWGINNDSVWSIESCASLRLEP